MMMDVERYVTLNKKVVSIMMTNQSETLVRSGCKLAVSVLLEHFLTPNKLASRLLRQFFKIYFRCSRGPLVVGWGNKKKEALRHGMTGATPVAAIGAPTSSRTFLRQSRQKWSFLFLKSDDSFLGWTGYIFAFFAMHPDTEKSFISAATS